MKESQSHSNQTTSDACCDSTEYPTSCATESAVCCEIPECCSMKGLLSFQILWLLSKHSRKGQELAEKLEIRRGYKPTPGTLYAALTELRKRGYIWHEKQGRTATYHLVEEKKEEVEQACRYFCHVFADIIEEYIGKPVRQEGMT